MKLYIFDIDGTLTDTTAVDDKCFIRTFERFFGTPLATIDFTKFQHVTDWGITEDLFLQTKGRTITPEEMNAFQTAFVQDLREEVSADKQQFAAIKGAAHYIRQLKAKQDIAIALATGAWRASATVSYTHLTLPTICSV